MRRAGGRAGGHRTLHRGRLRRDFRRLPRLFGRLHPSVCHPPERQNPQLLAAGQLPQCTQLLPARVRGQIRLGRDCRRPVGKRRNRLHRGLPHLRHAHVDQCLRPRRADGQPARPNRAGMVHPARPQPGGGAGRARHTHHFQPRHQRAASGIPRVRAVS